MSADIEPTAVDPQVCPKCGKPSASPPAEVYCVDCATEGWEKDAAAHRAVGVRPTAVDPRSGEVIDLANAPHADLVEAFLILQDHERRAKEWRTAVEDELVRRHRAARIRDRIGQIVGDFEIEVNSGRSREWDAEELEAVLHDLVESPSIPVKLKDVTGIITRIPKVDGTRMLEILGRINGDALTELEHCFTWKQRSRPTVKVTARPQLTQSQ